MTLHVFWNEQDPAPAGPISIYYATKNPVYQCYSPKPPGGGSGYDGWSPRYMATLNWPWPNDHNHVTTTENIAPGRLDWMWTANQSKVGLGMANVTSIIPVKKTLEEAKGSLA